MKMWKYEETNIILYKNENDCTRWKQDENTMMCILDTYMILYGRHFTTTCWTTDYTRICLIWWYPFMSIMCIVDACYQIATGELYESE